MLAIVISGGTYLLGKFLVFVLALLLALNPVRINLDDLNSTWEVNEETKAYDQEAIEENIEEVMDDFEGFMEQYMKEWVEENPPQNGKKYTKEELEEFKADAKEIFFGGALEGSYRDFMLKLDPETKNFIMEVTMANGDYKYLHRRMELGDVLAHRGIIVRFFMDRVK